jgi:hypothetical protein
MTSLPSSLAVRPLSPMEHGIWRTNNGCPLNFTTNARITGPLTAEILRAALPAVRARHPHLRARIASDGASYPVLHHDNVPPLELRVVSSGDWVKELEHEINHPVPDSGPLGRFTLVERGPNEAYVLITLHHSVGDGMSGVFLMRDLIEACAQGIAGQPPKLADLAIAPSIDAGLPSTFRGFRAWGHHVRFILRDLWMMLRAGKPLKVRRDQDLFAHSRRSRVIPQQLDRELSERLAARARAEHTTIHGAMAAAMILGSLADANVERAGIAFGTPVNLRPLLSPPVAEQVGFYVSMVLYKEVVSANAPFWDLARAVRRQLETSIARGDQLAIVDLLPKMLKLVAGAKLSPRALLEKFERAAPTTTGLTNLGRLSIQTTHGPLKIEDCHFAACPSALGDFLATATSLDGQIFWNFVWPDPVMTEAHAQSLVTAIVERLKQAAA